MDSASALDQLKAGNKRYIEGSLERLTPSPILRQHLAKLGQKPIAVIMGCSDSRTPAELIFDQGLGDLFVIRAAGNVVGPHAHGSILYAVAHLGARLVVVMGHTGCGAVAAAVEASKSAAAPKADQSPLNSILEEIKPCVERCKQKSGEEHLAHEVCKENARNSAALIGKTLATHCAELLPEVQIVSGLYHLQHGRVEFLDA